MYLHTQKKKMLLVIPSMLYKRIGTVGNPSDPPTLKLSLREQGDSAKDWMNPLSGQPRNSYNIQALANAPEGERPSAFDSF